MTIKFIKKFILSLFISAMAFLGIGLIILYGPYAKFRDYLITTAMTTFNHKWIATIFYDDETINEVLAKNVVIEPEGFTDSTLVNTGKLKLDKSDPFYPIDDKPYKIIEVSGNNWKGYLVGIYDASKIKLGIAKNIFVEGELISKGSVRTGGILAINASGFNDPGGWGNGGEPEGLIIKDGEVFFDDEPNMTHRVIGFDKNGVLTLLKATAQEAVNAGVEIGVEFGPFLIVNGVPATTYGTGGYGIHPRTAIGQRQDGLVLWLVIDGRQMHSLGATIMDVQNVMIEYGAFNAANLDGGSSSVLVENGVILNSPSSKYGEREVPNWLMLTE